MKKLLCVFLALFTLMLTGCGGGKEVYSGEGYEFAYDPDKWELNFVSDDGMADFKRKDFDEVSFAVERYDFEEQVSLEDRLKISEESCGVIGFIWDGGEILNIDGREWCRTEYRHEVREDVFKFVIFSTYNGKYTYIIDFTSDAANFDKCMKEFEEIFDSFKFTE